MNLLIHAVASLLAPFLLIGSSIGTAFVPAPVPASIPIATEVKLGASEAIPTTIAFFETTLASAISSSATTFTLTSATDKDGTTLASSTYAFVIDEGSSNEEIVIADCTATACTNASRGVSVRTGNTEVTALKKAHRRGASVKITDAPILPLLTRISRGEEGLPSASYYNSTVSTSSFSNDQQLVSKGYVDYLAFNGAGVIDALETAKGVVELATTLEQASSTPSGSSGPLVLQAKNATSTYNSATAANMVVVTGAGGKIDGDFVDISASSSHGDLYGYFGDGSDGDVTISSPTTLTSDKYYNNLTVNSTLNTDGFRIFVKGTLSGNGTIAGKTGSNGGNGGNGSGTAGSAGTAGASTGSGVFTTTVGTAGGAGGLAGAGNAGTAAAVIGIGTYGAPGGTGGTGSSGAGGTGASSTPSIATKFGILAHLTLMGVDISSAGSTTFLKPAGGSGGGGGGGGCGGTCGGGGGGGSGASGGMVWIVAKTWAGTFTITSVGGNGGNGGTGATNGGGGGGGAGGTGGASVVIYQTKTWTGSYTLTGGTKGTGGAGAGTGTAGADGTNGASGTSYEIAIGSLLR